MDAALMVIDAGKGIEPQTLRLVRDERWTKIRFYALREYSGLADGAA